MSDEYTTPPPLGRPDRQATDTQRGFVYQAWQAVYAWVNLGSQQTLFLEHAEDFDLGTPGAVEATQVKDTASQISLGRAVAREAIANYWRLRADNPDRDISFRFLTRSARGYERNRPFGQERGLDLWDRARRDGVDLTALRAFLAASELPDDLITFVKDASDDEVRTMLIRPIHWDTEAPNRQVVKSLVEAALVDHGQRQPLPVSPRVSRRVASALYTRVSERSSESGIRQLTFADFAILFEDETMELVPAGASSAHSARLARSGTAFRAQLSPGDPGFLEEITGTRLLAYSRRGGIVDEVLSRVEQMPLVVLLGSSGMGKSTLAELVAATAPGPWYRIDLRGLDPDQTADRIDRAALVLSMLPEGATVVADDLNFSERPERYENAIARLLEAIRLRAARFVVTSQNPIPSRIQALLPANEDPSYLVPPLDEEDLSDLVCTHGCPQDEIELWSKVIFIRTSGHPQLADAMAIGQALKGWPLPDSTDLLGTPPDLEKVKREARQRLRSGLPSDDAYELAVRLSVLSVPFTREQALRLANAPAPQQMAGADLDLLVGPWIEPTSGNRFRISLLIAGLFHEVLPADQHPHLHFHAAEALLTDPLGGYELSGALMHGLLGRNVRVLHSLAGALQKLNDWSSIATYLFWFPSWATGDAQRSLFPEQPLLSFLLRNIQFKIAAASGYDVQPVADAWLYEAEAVQTNPPFGVPPQVADRLVQSVTASVVINVQVPIPISYAFRLAERLVENIDMNALSTAASNEYAQDLDVFAASGDIGPVLTSLLSGKDFAEILSLRSKSAADLSLFLQNVEQSKKPLREILLNALDQEFGLTGALCNRTWIHEETLEEPDWQGVLKALDEAAVFARQHDLDALLAAAVRGKAVVLYEYLNDRAAAEKAISAIRDDLGSTAPRVEEYLGKILRMEGQYEEALTLYERLLPTWEEANSNTERTYAYNDAIISAGHLGKWNLAAYWAEEGYKAANPLSTTLPLVPLAYATDRAFALYKCGQVCDALETFAHVIDAFPKSKLTARLRMLTRRLSHMIVWIEGDLGGWRGRTIPEPPPGLASLFHEDEQEDIDILEEATLWVALDEAAVLAGCPSRYREHTTEAAKRIQNPLTRSQGAFALIIESIRTASPELFDVILSSHKTIIQAVAEMKAAPPVTRTSEGVLHFLTYGAIVALSEAVQDGSLVEVWRQSAEREELLEVPLDNWFEIASLAFAFASGNRRLAVPLTKILTDINAEPNARLIAAAALANRSADPDVQFLALATLLSSALGSPFAQAIGAAMARLAGETAQPGKGIQATARSVISRADSPTRRLPDGFREQIKSVAERGWSPPFRSLDPEASEEEGG